MRQRKVDLERRDKYTLAEELHGSTVELDSGSAAALAVLAIRWRLSPAQAMRRALLGIATGLGELPPRGEITGGK